MAIDYDKLKSAHEFAHEIPCCTFKWEIQNYTEKYTLWLTQSLSPTFMYYNIDDLITKLIELTQPEPKYKVGDKVFYLFHRAYTTLPPDIEKGEIGSVETDDEGELFYRIYSNAIPEESIHPTKQSLIESQISYWKNMLGEEFEQHISPYCEPNKCQHESDEIIYNLTLDKYSSLKWDYKCKKCGEFYR